jgi:hypothetical protein
MVWNVLIASCFTALVYVLHDNHAMRKSHYKHGLKRPLRSATIMYVCVLLTINMIILPMGWRLPWLDFVDLRVINKERAEIEFIYKREMQHEWQKFFFITTDMFGYQRIKNIQED